MRKVATLTEWKKLYDLADKYVAMKPWELLSNDEMVCIRFSDEDEAYFTIMGNGGMEYGFGMYIGEMAFHEMQLHLTSAYDDEQNRQYSLYLQNCIVMFMDKKEDVPEEQMAVIKKAGLKYGKGREWIYFENHARGYLPYIPDQKDVRNTTRFLERLLETLPLIEQVKPRGWHIPGAGHVYVQTKDGWKLGKAQWDRKELKHLPIAAIKQVPGAVEKIKKLKTSWEIDLVMTESIVDDKEYDRPLFPYMLVILDHKNGAEIFHVVLKPEDDPINLCMNLTNLIAEYGQPKKILVSGEIMKEILTPVEKALGLPIEIDHLRYMKLFIENYQKMFLSAGLNTKAFMKEMGLDDKQIQMLLQLAGVNSEEDAFDDFDFDDEEDEIAWNENGSMREKKRWIEEFFEFTYPYEENEDDDDWDEDHTSGMIDADWCDDWGMLIGQCKTNVLKEMAEKLGIAKVSGKKAQIAEEVIKALRAKPAKIKELLTDIERALLKALRELVNKQECEYSDSFPYTEETVLGLVEKGLADVKYGHNAWGIYLTLMIPKEMKGLRL